ncbi:MAG: DsbA family protein [Bdellovibrionales bacterium]|nr:DsbA family protein [Bdellovibrionales bacterium]
MIKSRIFSALAIATLLLAGTVSAEINDKEFEAALSKYLNTDKGQEQLGSAVESYFRKKQEEQAQQRARAAEREVENQFKNPVKIDTAGKPTKGAANAKVTIVEFSDFQCPYCKKGKETMEAVLKKYPNDVKIVFMNLPLPFHEQAMPSAKAALAAGKQGKFWEYHDKLFENQGKLGPKYYEQLAGELKLNVDKFKQDMNSKEITDQINKEQALAKQHGISGTPGFFVNGVAVKGAYPPEHFSRIIDRWLSDDPTKPTQQS